MESLPLFGREYSRIYGSITSANSTSERARARIRRPARTDVGTSRRQVDAAHAARTPRASAKNRSRFEHLGAQRSVDSRLFERGVEHARVSVPARSAASCARSCGAGRRPRPRACDAAARAGRDRSTQRAPLEPQHRRVDARRRQEAAAGDREPAGGRGEQPQLDGVGAVLPCCPGTRPCGRRPRPAP